jgi:hypothetical protein
MTSKNENKSPVQNSNIVRTLSTAVHQIDFVEFDGVEFVETITNRDGTILYSWNEGTPIGDTDAIWMKLLIRNNRWEVTEHAGAIQVLRAGIDYDA